MNDDALFAKAVAVVLAHEGGYSDDGPTNFGFDLRFNPDLTAEAIRAMTRDEAIARYRERWWTPYRWRELPFDVAVKVFDLAVNLGPTEAVRVLQRALWACGEHVKEDGVLGTATITAAADADSEALLAACRSEAASQYKLNAASSPKLSALLPGLLNRAYS